MQAQHVLELGGRSIAERPFVEQHDMELLGPRSRSARGRADAAT